MNGFYILLRAHDHVWLDRTIPLGIRMQASDLLWNLALAAAKADGISASIAAESESLVERAIANVAAGKL